MNPNDGHACGIAALCRLYGAFRILTPSRPLHPQLFRSQLDPGDGVDRRSVGDIVSTGAEQIAMVRENEIRDAKLLVSWAYPYALELPPCCPAARSHGRSSLPDRGFRTLDTGAKGA
jgi:hypothetical protein